MPVCTLGLMISIQSWWADKSKVVVGVLGDNVEYNTHSYQYGDVSTCLSGPATDPFPGFYVH